MRTKIYERGFTIWLSASDTYAWANKTGASWPCSTLSNKRLVAVFEENGLCDLAVNGRDAGDVDANELSAMVADYMQEILPKLHPCYNVAVEQFLAA